MQNTDGLAPAKGERRRTLFLIASSLDCVCTEAIKRVFGGRSQQSLGTQASLPRSVPGGIAGWDISRFPRWHCFK